MEVFKEFSVTEKILTNVYFSHEPEGEKSVLLNEFIVQKIDVMLKSQLVDIIFG